LPIDFPYLEGRKYTFSIKKTEGENLYNMPSPWRDGLDWQTSDQIAGYNNSAAAPNYSFNRCRIIHEPLKGSFKKKMLQHLAGHQI
jgi:hypothetical protein